MQDKAPGAREYVARAFYVQYNLILLCGALAFSLASASLIPFAVGLALEIAWLLLAPNFHWFRRWVDHGKAELALARAIEQLGDPDARRSLALNAAIREIHGLFQAEPHSELERALTKLEVLKSTFIEQCLAEQRLARFLAETPETELQQEIASLNQSSSAERDLGVRFTLKQAVKLAERRLAHRERVIVTRRAVQLRLSAIEKSVGYLRSQALSIGASPELLREVNTLTQQTGFAAALEPELRDLLEPISSNRPLGATAARATRPA
jgi:hypothetical protein